jgi:hypothetical protein
VTTTETKSKTALPRIPWWLGATLFAAIAVFFLWEEHRAHILGALPWLLLLACPLIHILMHRGHGHGSSSDREGDDHSHHHGGAR